MRYDTLDKTITSAIRKQLFLAIGVGGLFLGGVCTAAAYAEISGAVMAAGKIIVLGRAKQVEHADGGIISEIVVSEGDRVEAGALLFRLDGTTARANLGIIEGQLAQLMVQEARLLAEQAGRTGIDLPAELSFVPTDRRTLLTEAQIMLKLARQMTRSSQKAQLEKQVGQFAEQISALEAQRKAVDANMALLDDQLRRYDSLNARGLITQSQLIAMQREKASLTGSQSALTAEIIETQQAKTQAELKLIQVDEAFYESVLTELDQKRPEIAKLNEERVAALDKLRKLEIRAPIAGSLHQLNVHTIGSVAGPGETLVNIIPEDDELIVEAMISPADVDQVFGGQDARVRLSGLNQRVTPELGALVIDISPDLTTDEKTGASYYLTRLRIPEAEIAKVGDTMLKPGMPAEVFMQTENRTILSYMIKPLSDQLRHAMRES
ncbi:HlyD family type I secretion periplasmic adaptor subunit [Aliirhizobium cellulosilyticum]|uniref:Membrane fusion protein (MFP) family protein n=1 Tax=Aliirhizobium cellulosilyticum TaxID=393664 RepID=A0A7W6SA49_9HYPH|nr:HlyD family type I secretion periplasmic adaptor subunit [Rhizobium cellulosilyticum]MBB4349245.1 HlyD family secretion protein [Rhizobium cellulosilyticum]MBB4412534.1 HlyD family secretion protein [Rhizobium cellulosilyticum]MBB4447166.1 HlyD family secretion protein [Rhizobium cellulosilyticum]